MTTTPHYDAVLVGTGQANPTLAGDLADDGLRVAVCEESAFGGTCVNTGCTPTKTMVASARAAHMARRAADYGVVLPGPIQIDYAKVRARRDTIVSRFSTQLRTNLHQDPRITVYEGRASFVDAHTLAVNGATFTADKVFLNVGARSRAPQIEGLDDVPWLDNARLLDLEELPSHLVVLGGSYIGLEFAQMFRRFGADVTVIHDKARLTREDDDIADWVQRILVAEGVRVLTGAETRRAHMGDQGGIVLTVAVGGREERVGGSHLLVATGRTPNTDRLNLAAAGVATDKHGTIHTDNVGRSNVPHIYALGDVNGRGAFTHTSYNDYEVVLDHLRGGTRTMDDRFPAYAMYTDPPLGHVGLHEREVRDQGLPALMATMQMDEVSRARERDEMQGMMKVIVHAETKRFLGFTILGIEGDEVLHLVYDMMAADQPYTTMMHAMHVHPTVSELLPTLLKKVKPLDEAKAEEGHTGDDA